MEHTKTNPTYAKNAGAVGPLVDLSVRLENETRMKEFRDLFARTWDKGYILQHPDRDWRFKGKPVSDPLLRAHLRGQYWVGVPANWRVQFAVVDFDRPTEHIIQTTIERLKLSKGQYLLMTSPSWWDKKSCHLYVPVEYKGRPPTCNLSLAAIGAVIDPRLELYPQPKKCFRLPLGRKQFIIGEDGFPQGWIDWKSGLDELLGLDPLALETLPFSPELPFPETTPDYSRVPQFPTHSEMGELWREGLQESGSRHATLKRLAVWFFRKNVPPDLAIEELVDWQLKKSNGFSELVRRGDRDVLRTETARIVNWFYEKIPAWPDSTHNLDAAVSASDVIQGAQLFPGDVVNQKRWFSLCRYYRPRRRHGWVYCGWEQWRDGCKWENVASFQQTLESKGVAEFRRTYRHVEGRPDLSFSQMVKIKLERQHDVPLESDGRNVVEFYTAVRELCPTVHDAVSLTGIAKQRFSDAKKRQKSDNSFEIK